ncbi:MAG: hypothetical protein CBB65_08730 [Hyphomonadaceae bacterium TMED5]|nr:hypothetical protein [Ponticaulis sp.]OUY00204.1 MAG: hypothetical protein CBB65_08730 [Hyphomonadaceae bacterium TMED5]
MHAVIEAALNIRGVIENIAGVQLAASPMTIQGGSHSGTEWPCIAFGVWAECGNRSEINSGGEG